MLNTNRDTNNNSLWAFLLPNTPLFWPALLQPKHKTQGLSIGGHLFQRPALWGLALPDSTTTEHASSSHSAGLHLVLTASAMPPSTSTLHFLPFQIPAHFTSLLSLTLSPRIAGESLSDHRAHFIGAFTVICPPASLGAPGRHEPGLLHLCLPIFLLYLAFSRQSANVYMNKMLRVVNTHMPWCNSRESLHLLASLAPFLLNP